MFYRALVSLVLVCAGLGLGYFGHSQLSLFAASAPVEQKTATLPEKSAASAKNEPSQNTSSAAQMASQRGDFSERFWEAQSASIYQLPAKIIYPTDWFVVGTTARNGLVCSIVEISSESNPQVVCPGGALPGGIKLLKAAEDHLRIEIRQGSQTSVVRLDL